MDARAAELLFRTQKISVIDDGSVMAADHETVERHALESGFGSLGELLKQGGIPLRSVDLDVIQDSNEETYWDRSERFDMVACLNLGQPLIESFCRVSRALDFAFHQCQCPHHHSPRNRRKQLGLACRLGCASQQHVERFVQRPKH
jgi:hypothetical protein